MKQTVRTALLFLKLPAYKAGIYHNLKRGEQMKITIRTQTLLAYSSYRMMRPTQDCSMAQLWRKRTKQGRNGCKQGQKVFDMTCQSALESSEVTILQIARIIALQSSALQCLINGLSYFLIRLETDINSYNSKHGFHSHIYRTSAICD